MKIYKITDELSSEYERILPVHGVSKGMGCNLAWLKTLVKLKEEQVFPSLVLESDANQVRPLENFDTPNDCDMVYYGVCKLDEDPEKIWQEEYYEVDSYPHLIKLKRMATTHAVCFYNKSSVQAALEYTSAALCNNVFLDVVWAHELMPRFNVYALRKPIFTQGTSHKDNFYYKNTNILL